MWLSSPGFERAWVGHGLNNGLMTLPDQALAQYFWPALEPHTSAVGSGLGSLASAPSRRSSFFEEFFLWIDPTALGGTLPPKTANRRTGPNDSSATPAAPNGNAFRCRFCPVKMRVLLRRCGLRSQDEDTNLPCLLAPRRRLRILCSVGGDDETAEKILCMGLC
jgi:hypothetical protein